MNEALAAELKAMAQEGQRIRTLSPEQEKKFAVRMSRRCRENRWWESAMAGGVCGVGDESRPM